MSWRKWTSPRRTSTGLTSRRAFLGGAAAMLTLPMMESLRSARAAGAVAPVRTLFWYVPNGVVMQDWRPAPGALSESLPRILAPLTEHRSELLVISGLANRPADLPVPGDHAMGTGSFLTCREIRHTSGANIENGISIDQEIANAVRGSTPFGSLELGTTGGASVGDCDSGFSCAYTRNISWIDDDTPNPKVTDPELVFNRLFAGTDLDLSASEAERRRSWRTSVLDHVLEDASSLEPTLSAGDRNKLDEFMTGVRELELRILGGNGECAPSITRPSSRLSYSDSVRAMTDLMVVALECDLTRVITFMMENGGSYRSFDFLGVTGAHHELSHHQEAAYKLEALSTINTWELEQFAYLVRRLSETTDVDGGTLLDNTVAFLSSEIGDGDWHNHDDLPVLLAGRGGGAVQTGRHLSLSETPIADLYLALANVAGAPLTRFGEDGTQALALS